MLGAKRANKAGRSYVVHPNVSRFEYPGEYGYRVRFSRLDDDGVPSTVTKSFSDAVYGRRARALAIEWRENYAKNLAPRESRAQPPGYWYIKKMRVSNNSQGELHHYLAYVGFLRIEDRRHLSTRWSIDKWGERIAKRRCQEWVEKKTSELKLRLRAAKSNARKLEEEPPPKSTTRVILKPPLIKMTQQACGECGGPIATVTGPGRRFEYKPHVKGAIPSDFPTNTCATCGEHYLTSAEYEALCNVMLEQERLNQKKTKRRKVSKVARKAHRRKAA